MKKILQPHILALFIIPGVLISGIFPELLCIGAGLSIIGGYNLGVVVVHGISTIQKNNRTYDLFTHGVENGDLTDPPIKWHLIGYFLLGLFIGLILSSLGFT